MKPRYFFINLLTTAVFFLAIPLFAEAQEWVTLENAPDELEEIVADEAIAPQFSAKNAARYLDRASLSWQKKKKCATCHANMPYRFARPALSSVLPDSGEVRKFYEEYKTERWKKNGLSEKQGFWPIVVGVGLVFNDRQTTGKLNEVTREVLDLIWTVSSNA